MFTNDWLRWGRIYGWEVGAVGALLVKNPAPSEPDIRKHPSKNQPWHFFGDSDYMEVFQCTSHVKQFLAFSQKFQKFLIAKLDLSGIIQRENPKNRRKKFYSFWEKAKKFFHIVLYMCEIKAWSMKKDPL